MEVGFLEGNGRGINVCNNTMSSETVSCSLSLGPGVLREAVAGAEEVDGASHSGPYNPY